MPKMLHRNKMLRKQFLAWCVHAYTASGLVVSAFIMLELLEATPASFRSAFLLMVLATFIDATDGMFARAAQVKIVLPQFSGRKLDDIIDFLNFTALPLLLIYQAKLLPDGHEFWLLFPLVASAYGFCQENAKTEDGYFLGFPSYWNIVVFYLYVLEPPFWLTIVILIGLAILTFVPLCYLYPTQKGTLNLVTSVFGALWAILMVWIIIELPTESIQDKNGKTELFSWMLLSLAFPVYYVVASWSVSLGRMKNKTQRCAQ